MRSSSELDEQDSFLEKAFSINDGPRVEKNTRLWKRLAISSLLLVFIQIGLMVYWACTGPGTPKAGLDATGQVFDTDLEAFKSSIKLVKKRFTGALHPDKNGDMMLMLGSSQPKYTGEPREEVDKNWNTLIEGRYFLFTDKEQRELDTFARQAGTQTPSSAVTKEFDSLGTYGGIDMFHSLHCLNALRIALDGSKDVPYSAYQQNMTRIHLDHCVEQLRQAILCHGDLTPVTLTPVYSEGSHTLNLLGQTEYEHTCRDWRAFRKIMDGRESFDIAGWISAAR